MQLIEAVGSAPDEKRMLTLSFTVFGPQGRSPSPSAMVVGCDGTHQAGRATPSEQWCAVLTKPK